MFSFFLSGSVRHAFFLAATSVVTMNAGAANSPEQTLRGAKSVMAEWPSPSPSSERETYREKSHRFRDELATFRNNASTLSESEAAQSWLHLVDTYFRRSPPSVSTFLLREPEELPGFDAVLAALPPVKAWPQLAAAIKQRPVDSTSSNVKELALKLLGARLADDPAEQSRIRAQLRLAVKVSKRPEGPPRVGDFLQQETMEPDAAIENFTRTIESYEPAPKTNGYYSSQSQLQTPDLVGLLGVDKAKPLIVKALLSSIPTVVVKKGEGTRQLAVTCVLESIDRLTLPRWNLAQRLGSPELFEALEKRFGPPRKRPSAGPLLVPADPEDFDSSLVSEYAEAYGYYILNLVIAGRQTEAIERALSSTAPHNEELLESGAKLLANRGRANEIAEFLHGVLSQRPELPWWRTYVEIAARAGQSSEALNLLKTSAASTTIPASQKQSIEQHLAGALLADDQVEAGAAELERTMASAQPTGTEQRGIAKEAASNLLNLGIVLNQASWIDAAAARLVTLAAAEKSYYEAESVARDLVKAKRYREAETLLADAIKTELQSSASRGEPSDSSNITSLLINLVSLYHEAQYYPDVLILLDRAPFWGASEITEIPSYSSEAGLLTAAATALIETGSNDRAMPILRRLIEKAPGLDQGYQLWLKTAPADLEKQLDALAVDDPFEERPLIWKAEYQRRAGRLDEAEKACRAAIAIDPSDGEQPAGDRLRVYSVLADVRASQGDLEQAKTYRRVVQAIRLAERADQLFQAGLLKRAILLYNEALGLFSDAYCIQSRLAIRLAESGRLQEAEEHYRRAYELMPDSFGRVESHCFGCEHAFGPENAQMIAERVFTQFVEKNSSKPQIHYLLGYLRSEQDRPKEALLHYQEATRLDPDYLNAWKKIVELGDDLDLPPNELSRSAENILRLDPRGRHVSLSINNIRELKILFRHADSQTARVAKRVNIYPLEASAAVLHKAGDPTQSYLGSSDEGVTREKIVHTHPFFELLTTLVRESNYSTED